MNNFLMAFRTSETLMIVTQLETVKGFRNRSIVSEIFHGSDLKRLQGFPTPIFRVYLQ
jgi:hypothetical protein